MLAKRKRHSEDIKRENMQDQFACWTITLVAQIRVL